jgi:hypothetical protein
MDAGTQAKVTELTDVASRPPTAQILTCRQRGHIGPSRLRLICDSGVSNGCGEGFEPAISGLMSTDSVVSSFADGPVPAPQAARGVPDISADRRSRDWSGLQPWLQRRSGRQAVDLRRRRSSTGRASTSGRRGIVGHVDEERRRPAGSAWLGVWQAGAAVTRRGIAGCDPPVTCWLVVWRA